MPWLRSLRDSSIACSSETGSMLAGAGGGCSCCCCRCCCCFARVSAESFGRADAVRSSGWRCGVCGWSLGSGDLDCGAGTVVSRASCGCDDCGCDFGSVFGSSLRSALGSTLGSSLGGSFLATRTGGDDGCVVACVCVCVCVC